MIRAQTSDREPDERKETVSMLLAAPTEGDLEGDDYFDDRLSSGTASRPYT